MLNPQYMPGARKAFSRGATTAVDLEPQLYATYLARHWGFRSHQNPVPALYFNYFIYVSLICPINGATIYSPLTIIIKAHMPCAKPPVIFTIILQIRCIW